MTTYNNIDELLAQDGNGSFYQWGRSLYKNVDCGPWCRLILEDGSDIYYESDKANNPITNKVVALEIGSIVEGSDVEIGGYSLKFPFTDNDLWGIVEQVNEEAKFYWDRDNTDDYFIEVDGNTYYLKTGWGLEFSENTPQSVKNFVDNFIDDIEEMEDGEEIEIQDYKISKMDKSDFIF